MTLPLAKAACTFHPAFSNSVIHTLLSEKFLEMVETENFAI